LTSARHAQEPTVDDLSGGETVPRTGAVGADLPLPGTKRWVARRKAALVAAVRNGIIDLDEACRRYEVSEEEFRAWERAIEAHGVASLQISRLQIYRNAPLREKPY
jgi:Protein of unknown function (DUF1153)